MATVLEEIAALEKQLAEKKAAAAAEIEAKKEEVMHEVLDHMKENGIEVSELVAFARIAGSKYSNEKGDTWSGRGKKPQWIDAILGGITDQKEVAAKLEPYLTKKNNAVEKPLAVTTA